MNEQKINSRYPATRLGQLFSITFMVALLLCGAATTVDASAGEAGAVAFKTANNTDTLTRQPKRGFTFSLDMVIPPPPEFITELENILNRDYDPNSESLLQVTWSASVRNIAGDKTKCIYPGGHVVLVYNGRPKHLEHIAVPGHKINPLPCNEMEVWLRDQFIEVVKTQRQAIAQGAVRIVR